MPSKKRNRPKRLQHGKASTYTIYDCRCKRCTKAASDAQMNRRAAKSKLLAKDSDGRMRTTADVPHGKASTYTNWDCRCRPCTDASTELGRFYKNQKRLSGERTPKLVEEVKVVRSLLFHQAKQTGMTDELKQARSILFQVQKELKRLGK